jgi:hypothetical protein
MRELATNEGIIEDGRVSLPSDAGSPEKTRVYVSVPEAETLSVASPHLADPQQARDFQMEVIEDATKAGV